MSRQSAKVKTGFQKMSIGPRPLFEACGLSTKRFWRKTTAIVLREVPFFEADPGFGSSWFARTWFSFSDSPFLIKVFKNKKPSLSLSTERRFLLFVLWRIYPFKRRHELKFILRRPKDGVNRKSWKYFKPAFKTGNAQRSGRNFCHLSRGGDRGRGCVFAQGSAGRAF